MARALRIAFRDALYHLCARGNRGEQIFSSKDDFGQFEQLLAESVGRYQIELYSYVLLPNHFHLLARTLKPNVSRWMHWLITAYSVWFNRSHQLIGHVFQGRYKGLLVQEGDYLLELSRYLHLNPVRGSTLGNGSSEERQTRLRDYQWSSYRGYAGLGQQRQFVREDLILEEFSGGKSDPKPRIQYREFEEEGLRQNIANPFRQVRRQIALGDELFEQRLSKKFKAIQDRQREVTGLMRGRRAADCAQLIERVARHYGIPRQTLTDRDVPGSEARNVAIWLLRQKGGLTLREIGELFGGIDYAAISQRVRRLSQRIGKRKRLRTTCKMLNHAALRKSKSPEHSR